MADRSDELNFLQDLHRFAFILTQDSDASRTIVGETLDEALKRHEGHMEHERLMVRCFQGVRKRALKLSPGAGPWSAPDEELPEDAGEVVDGGDAGRILAALQALPEPGRSAMAMLALKTLDAEAIEKMLGVGLPELSDAVHAARHSLLGACRASPATGTASE